MISIASSYNMVVHDNVIDYNQTGEGIDFKNGTHDSIAYNNSVSHTSSHGMYMDGWDSGVYNNKFFNNTIHDSPTGGIAITNERWSSSHDLDVYNNVVYNCGVGIGVGWYGHGTMTRVNIVNNTFYNSGLNPFGTYGGMLYGSPSDIVASNVVLRNNIFSGGPITINTSRGYPFSAVDHNGFYNTNAIGTNNVIANPLFVNAPGGGFHLQAGSPMINKGSATGAPATDLDGIQRPQGTGFDIGAYEFTKSIVSQGARPVKDKKGE